MGIERSGFDFPIFFDPDQFSCFPRREMIMLRATLHLGVAQPDAVIQLAGLERGCESVRRRRRGSGREREFVRFELWLQERSVGREREFVRGTRWDTLHGCEEGAKLTLPAREDRDGKERTKCQETSLGTVSETKEGHVLEN